MDNYYMTPTSDKSKATALILCVLFGWLGLHRFYVGKVITGLLYACTCGLFGIGWLVDILAIAIGGFRDNAGMCLRK